MKIHHHSMANKTANHLRKGGVMVGMIAVMIVMGVMGVTIVTLSRTSDKSYLSANPKSRAYYLAESGLHYAQSIYCAEGWRHGRERTLRLDGGDEVTVVRLFNDFWATAIVDEGTAKQARARVPMPLSFRGNTPNPEAEFSGDLAILGDIAVSIGHNTLVQGDVAITDQDVMINGNVNGSVLARNVAFNGTSTLTGDIFASGSVDIENGDVTGDIHSVGGITVSSQSTVVGGWIFSDATVVLNGSAQVQGHIHVCNGDVILSGGTLAGSANNPIEVRASGNVQLTGSAKIYGDVYAGGSVTLDGGAEIHGDVYAGGSINGPLGTKFSGLTLPNAPTFVKQPFCPDLTDLDGIDLPPATEFTAGGSNVHVNFNDQVSLPPGVYGDLSTSGWSGENTQLTLSAGSTDDGVYFFDSVFLGQNLTLRLDLSGTHDLHVLVEGDIEGRGALNTLVTTDGTNYYPITDPAVDKDVAARVYWESLGDFSLEFQSNWFGSVYTPEGNLRVEFGGHLVGSVFSGGGHNLAGTTIIHVTPNYFSGN